MKSIKAVVITLLLAGLLVAFFTYWRSLSIPVENKKDLDLISVMEMQGIPVFDIETSDGKKLSLSNLKGKVVIVNFWASWCAPCVEEIPSLIKLVEEFNGKIALIAVSQDASIDEMNAFLKSFPSIKNKNTFVVWKNRLELAKLFNIQKLPESFIASKDLKLVKKIVGTIDWYTLDSKDFMNALIK